MECSLHQPYIMFSLSAPDFSYVLSNEWCDSEGIYFVNNLPQQTERIFITLNIFLIQEQKEFPLSVTGLFNYLLKCFDDSYSL